MKTDTAARDPSCRIISQRKVRPAIDMKKAAVAPEPPTITR